MNLLKPHPAPSPELWLAAVVVAAVGILTARWAVLSARFVPPLETGDYLARWEVLAAYLSAPRQVATEQGGATPVSFGDPFDAPRYALVSPPAARRGVPRVTAILISDQRQLAIIDDRIVGVGDALLGAGRVEAIEPEQVVLNLNGRREILRLLPQTRTR